MRLAFLVSLSALAYGQSRPVEATYDKATNQTLFTGFSAIRVPPTAQDRLPECRIPHTVEYSRFQVTYACPGDASGCSNGKLVIKFSFCTTSWTFNTVQLSMAIDGRPVALPPSVHPSSVLTAAVLDDSVSVEVPLSATRGLSSDSKIEVNLGVFNYELSRDNVSVVRAVAERIR